MTTSHAPGPWAVTNGIVSFIDHGKRYPIASAWNNPALTSECQQANLRLISAAPDLLSALQELHDAAAAYFQDFEHLHPIIRNRLAEARAAIAKATGEG